MIVQKIKRGSLLAAKKMCTFLNQKLRRVFDLFAAMANPLNSLLMFWNRCIASLDFYSDDAMICIF